MSIRSRVWYWFINVYPAFLRKVKKMDIGENVKIAPLAHIDKTYPQGVHIGNRTAVLKGAFVLTHDSVRRIHTDTYIGSDCYIGINSIILPGVKIGNEVIIGAGSIVTKNIPSNCIAVGNPAKVIRTGIHVVNGVLQN